jgi:hypothetical protein
MAMLSEPGLQLKITPHVGPCGTMAHDYKRHGTTTLFAALNVLEAKVIVPHQRISCHQHQEFIRFLDTANRERYH